MHQFLYFSIFVFCLNTFHAISQSDKERAVTLFQLKEFDAAKTVFESHLNAFPDDWEAIEYMGDIAAHQQNWDDAVEIYEELTLQFPQNANYHYKLGGSMAMKATQNRWYALTHYKNIETQFKTALSLDNSHIDVHWALIEYYLQLPWILGGTKEKAELYANQLHQISPVDGYLAKGRIADYYKDAKAGETAYKKAVEVGRSEHTYQKLIAFYRNTNNHSKADKVLQQALKKYPNFEEKK